MTGKRRRQQRARARAAAKREAELAHESYLRSPQGQRDQKAQRERERAAARVAALQQVQGRIRSARIQATVLARPRRA